MRRLLIRADATAEIGAGHVMRCLALAQGWRDQGGAVLLVGQVAIRAAAERLVAEGIEVQPSNGATGSIADAEATLRLTREFGATHVIVDGYSFASEFCARLGDAAIPLLVLDDDGRAARYRVDLVLNPSCAGRSSYDVHGSRARLLLGPRFALLRREFLRWRKWERQISERAERLLVTAGGSDPQRLARRVATVLAAHPESSVPTVILGTDTPFANAVGSNVEFRRSTFDMPALMAEADVAVAAAGGTAWELAFMGLPGLLVSVAENQRGVAAALGVRGAAIDLGWHSDLVDLQIVEALARLAADGPARLRMSRSGRELVDGEGVDRVLMQLTSEPVRLRPVQVADRQRVWQWANDPEVRAQSFSPERIAWAEHVQWFASRLGDDSSPFWIGVNEAEEPVGQIRFSCGQNATAEVHLLVAPGHRRRGVGTTLLRLALGRLFARSKIRSVVARVRNDNRASLRAFSRAGFVPNGCDVVKGVAAQRLVFRSDA